jgi:hypothetical protein
VAEDVFFTSTGKGKGHRLHAQNEEVVYLLPICSPTIGGAWPAQSSGRFASEKKLVPFIKQAVWVLGPV